MGQANYGAAKAGIAAFTMIAAQELSRYGVTVNCLAPNARTRMTSDIFAGLPEPEDGGYDPLSPDNISPIVVALASDGAGGITGQVFFVYGPAINVLTAVGYGDIDQSGLEVGSDRVGTEAGTGVSERQSARGNDADGLQGSRTELVAEDELIFDLPVELEHVQVFARAVGEDNPVFFDAEVAEQHGFPNVVAPPTFTTTQILQVPREERERRLGANLDYERVLHGEQEFIYKRLPVAGETLKGRMRISKDFTKEGKRGGSMRFVTYESVFTDEAGDEVLTAFYTLIETAKDVG